MQHPEAPTPTAIAHARIAPSLRQRLEEPAEGDDRSVASVISRALHEHVERSTAAAKTTAGELGSMTGGRITTGPALGFGAAKIEQ